MLIILGQSQTPKVLDWNKEIQKAVNFWANPGKDMDEKMIEFYERMGWRRPKKNC